MYGEVEQINSTRSRSGSGQSARSSQRSTRHIHAMAATPAFLQNQSKCIAGIPGYCGYIAGKSQVIGAGGGKANNIAMHTTLAATKPQSYGKTGQTYHTVDKRVPGYSGYKAGIGAENVFGHTHAKSCHISLILQKNRIKEKNARKWIMPHQTRVPGMTGPIPAYPAAPV